MSEQEQSHSAHDAIVYNGNASLLSQLQALTASVDMLRGLVEQLLTEQRQYHETASEQRSEIRSVAYDIRGY